MNKTELAHLAFADHSEPQAFAVNFWGSDPALDNDDCWTGVDFATREQAEAFYADPFGVWEEAHRLGLTTWQARHLKRDTAFVQIDGPGINMAKATGTRIRTGSSLDVDGERDADLRHELAMEAGMLGGCDAYNEIMGY